MDKKRDRNIDIVKGICIILMVAGHSKIPQVKFIYLFHMAIFFIASGYLFKQKYADSFENMIEFIKHKVIGLWIPFFVWNGTFTLLNNIFINTNIYARIEFDVPAGAELYIMNYKSAREILIYIVKGFYMGNFTLMGNALWFLKTLFIVSIMYCMIQYLLKKSIVIAKYINWIQCLLSIMFLVIGYLCSLHNYDLKGLAKGLSFYCLFYVGYMMRELNLLYISDRVRNAGMLISFIILLIMNQIGSIDLSDNKYTNPIFLLIVSISGWVFIFGVGNMLRKNLYLSNVLYKVAENSMAIVILHYLSFKIVSCFIVIIYEKSWELIACYPVIYSNGGWWLVYSIVGISIPIALNKLRKCLKLLILNKRVLNEN